jgi:hypothetical protein
MFAETLKTKPIRFAWKPEAAAGHSAELVEKVIVALLPLTEPRKATPCENATAVAKLLYDGVHKLRSLQPVAPNGVESNNLFESTAMSPGKASIAMVCSTRCNEKVAGKRPGADAAGGMSKKGRN